jgi:endonuclease I
MVKILLRFIFLFCFTLPFYGQIQPYYNGMDFTKTGNELFLDLSDRIESTQTAIPYTSSSIDTWDALKLADEVPTNNLKVVLIYGFDDNDGDYTTDRTRLKTMQDASGGDQGSWNREHVFAKSLANPNLSTEEPGPGTDVFNLRPADTQRNSDRSNRKFSAGSGDSGIISSNGGWYPGDEWKGDIARMVMYMYVRYHGVGSKISETQCLPINVGFGSTLSVDPNMIDLFLNWNVEDPVSSFEDSHNDIIESIQGNRNPFIDNPYLATLIWGGLNAEDRWNLDDNSDSIAPTIPTNIIASNVTENSVELNWDESTDNEGVIDYLIYLNGVYLQSVLSNSVEVSGLNASTDYEITIKARDAASNLSGESAKVSFTTLVGPNFLFVENFDDCANLEFVTYNEASDKNWECQTLFGENNSGSMGINGYQQDVLSKDWLITKNPINFDASSEEKLSFYADASYGSSTLELVYSNDYSGQGSPLSFTWNAVPNVTIPTHPDGSGTEVVFTFNSIDISSLTGQVYFAFRYYSNNNPTRWTVDSFSVTAKDDLLAVDDLDAIELKLISAYPNPSNGNFQIKLPLNLQEVRVRIFSLQAQLLASQTYQVKAGKIQIDLRNKPAGMYIVRLDLPSSKVIKVIKI